MAEFMQYLWSALQTVGESIWDMLNEMSPYLLLGFLIAGLMHVFIPGSFFRKYLSGNGFKSVLNAALLGIPLPLCSCGVIPTAMSLKKDGASKGATASFLVATPQTGIDSILASYSMLGLAFAIIRPIAALVTALFAGQMVNLVDHETQPTEANHQHQAPSTQHPNFFHQMKEVLKYAYVEMMGDIGKWLVVGIIVAGLIALCPDEWFTMFKENSWASIILVLAISIPMYLCATGSIPIAVALMLKGLTPGAGLVLLMAGPASNIASILIINKVLGRKTLVTYLASIILGAIGFAFIIDYLLPAAWFVLPLQQMGSCCHEEAGWFSMLCSIVLCLMLAYVFLFHRHHHDHCHCGCEEGHDHCHCGEDHCDCEDDETIVLLIDGMHCSHCTAAAEKALRGCKGVEEVNVSLLDKQAIVTGEHLSMEEMKKAVEDIGFTVKESEPQP